MKRHTDQLIALIAVILMSFTSPLIAGEISLSSGIDKTDIAFEDSLKLTVELRWDGLITDYLFTLQPLVETENLIVTGSNRAISSGIDNGVDYTIRTFKYTLKPTMSGTGIINPVVISYLAMPDSIPGELSTQDYKILIAKPVVIETESNSSITIIIISAVVVIAIVMVIVVIRRRKDREPSEPVRSNEEVFLDELANIKKEAQTDRKLFFTRLHKQLVIYLSDKHGVNIIGKTNQAILDEFNGMELPLDYKEKLSAYIAQAEKEKYAPTKGEPGDIIKLCTELENYFNEIKN